ncbi:MAG: response regulator [Promethearchaeota archaeon]|nr:MAG: response regulator [Candidatus Lokiarchaeota archaeon]
MIKDKKILIVDDEVDVTGLAEKFLKLEGFKTITCNSGKEALDVLENDYNEIALVLLDILMPEMSGFTVLKEIKANENYKDIMIVMFTVLDNQIEKARELGADGYLKKPFPGKELIKFVKDKLNV